MDRSDFNGLGEYLKDEDISKLVKKAEESAILHMDDPDSIYYAHVPKIGNKEDDSYSMVNLNFIIEDLLLKPISDMIFKEMGLHLIQPAGLPGFDDYHLLVSKGYHSPEVYLMPNKYQRDAISSDLDLSQAVSILIKKIQKPDPKETPVSFTPGQNFQVIDVYSLIWEEIVNPLGRILHFYLTEKYNNGEDTSFFHRPDIHAVNYDGSFDLFMFDGYKEFMTSLGRKAELCEIWMRKQEGYFSGKLTKTERIIKRELASAAAEIIVGEVERAKDYKEKSSHVTLENGYASLDIWSVLRSRYSENALDSWMYGLYFKEEGAYIAPLGRYVVLPTEDNADMQEIKEQRQMQKIALDVVNSTLAIAKENKDGFPYFRITFHHFDTVYGWNSKDQPLMPVQYLKFHNTYNAINYRIMDEAMKNLPYKEIWISELEQQDNNVYLSGNSHALVWNARYNI